MEQLNNELPVVQEEKLPVAEVVCEIKQEPLLLRQVRKNFGFFGGISLAFGGLFTILFYKKWIGLNTLLFTFFMIYLLFVIMEKLSLQVKTGTKLYFAGAVLLSISTCYTSSGILQFLNIVGILALLDLSLIHQFYASGKWDFTKHIGKMLSLILYSIAAIGMPFVDCISFFKKTKVLKNDLFRNIVIGLVVSIPLLIIITSLLSGADLLFGELTKNIFDFGFSADIITIFFMVLFGFMACYCILCGVLSRTESVEKMAIKKADASIAITFMTLLCLVYAVFCGIQLIYLFTNRMFTLPQEFTFAEYARRGFFELLAVTIINIGIILLCRTLFQKSKLLRLLVTLMTACTYIIIVSATYRMLLYIGAYHLTFLRLFVLLALFIDALVLAGVVIAEYKDKFPLFQYCIVVTLISYLVFSFARPDCYIASYLDSQNEILEIEDLAYLTQDLSLDAAPYVVSLINETERWQKLSGEDSQEYDRYIYGYQARLANAKRNIGIRDFNYSYYEAGKYASSFLNK